MSGALVLQHNFDNTTKTNGLDQRVHYPSATPSGFEFVLLVFGFDSPFGGVKRGLKIILNHRAPSSLNISSYRSRWTISDQIP